MDDNTQQANLHNDSPKHPSQQSPTPAIKAVGHENPLYPQYHAFSAYRNLPNLPNNNLLSNVNPYLFLQQNPYLYYQYMQNLYPAVLMNNEFNRLKFNIVLGSLLNNQNGSNNGLRANTSTLEAGKGDELDALLHTGNGRRNSFQSTSTACGQSDVKVNFLMKPRERYVKNNKLVYVHSSKTPIKRTNPKSDGVASEDGRGLDELSTSKKSRGSKYRGVSRNGNQWQVLIMVNKKKRYVGSFSTEEEAARVYDKVSLQNHGSKAKTNYFYTEDEIKSIINSPSVLTKDDE